MTQRGYFFLILFGFSNVQITQGLLQTEDHRPDREVFLSLPHTEQAFPDMDYWWKTLEQEALQKQTNLPKNCLPENGLKNPSLLLNIEAWVRDPYAEDFSPLTCPLLSQEPNVDDQKLYTRLQKASKGFVSFLKDEEKKPTQLFLSRMMCTWPFRHSPAYFFPLMADYLEKLTEPSQERGLPERLKHLKGRVVRLMRDYSGPSSDFSLDITAVGLEKMIHLLFDETLVETLLQNLMGTTFPQGEAILYRRGAETQRDMLPGLLSCGLRSLKHELIDGLFGDIENGSLFASFTKIEIERRYMPLGLIQKGQLSPLGSFLSPEPIVKRLFSPQADDLLDFFARWEPWRAYCQYTTHPTFETIFEKPEMEFKARAKEALLAYGYLVKTDF